MRPTEKKTINREECSRYNMKVVARTKCLARDQVRRAYQVGQTLGTWGNGREEFVPCFHGGSREEIGGRGRRGTIVNTWLTGYDFVTKGGHLSSDNTDRSRAGVGDESRLVVAKDKLPNEREGLQLEH